MYTYEKYGYEQGKEKEHMTQRNKRNNTLLKRND